MQKKNTKKEIKVEINYAPVELSLVKIDKIGYVLFKCPSCGSFTGVEAKEVRALVKKTNSRKRRDYVR